MKDICLVDPSNESEWDHFVESHPAGWLHHLSAWKKLIEEAFPHIKGYYIVIRNNGILRSAIPIYAVRSWLLGRRLVSIPFATICQPLISNDEDYRIILKEAINLGTDTGSSQIEIRLMDPAIVQSDGGWTVSNSFKIHYLNLGLGLDALWKGFDRTCVRQRIARAEKSSLGLKKVDDYNGLREFYRLYLMTRRRLGLPPHPYKFISLLWENFSKTGNVVVWLAEHDGKNVSAILLLKYRDRVSAEYMVSDETFREMSPNHFLFWHAIREAHQEGARIFDFGRTDERNSNLMDFKRRWGTVVEDLPIQCHSINGNTAMSKNNHTIVRGAIREICMRAPDPLLERFGNFIYSHMG